MKKIKLLFALIGFVAVISSQGCEKRYHSDVWIQLNNNSADSVYFFSDDNPSLSMVRPHSQLSRLDYSGDFDDESYTYGTVYLKKKGSILEVDGQIHYKLYMEEGRQYPDAILNWDGTTLSQQ
jgi:hypothetical protein